jgi:hypothetical protein
MMEFQSIKILSIDPALRNVGWMVGIFDPNSYLENGPQPSWLAKDDTPYHTYHCYKKLDGGTLTRKNVWTVHERLTYHIDELHLISAIHKPDMIALESQIEAGGNRCTWGVALQFGIIFPYFLMHRRQVRLSRCPDEAWVDNPQLNGTPIFSHVDHVPSYGVAIKPPQLQSIAHGQRVTEGADVISRYREVTGDAREKISDHEADAYFIAIHAARFWATCMIGCWAEDFLSKKEKRAFLNQKTGMITRRLESWWTNF